MNNKNLIKISYILWFIAFVLSIMIILDVTNIQKIGLNGYIYAKTMQSKDLSISYENNQSIIRLNKSALFFDYVSCCGSMHPIEGNGNTIIEEELEPNDTVEIGDIVSYRSEDRVYIHQIIFKYDNCYIFKGTNVIMPDLRCVRREDMINREIGVIFTK